MSLSRLLTILLVVACANVTVFVVEALLYTPFRVPTSSMRPTLQEGDHIAIRKQGSTDRDVKRGDLVVFAVLDREPVKVGTPGSQLLVKRVVGLPQESIEGHDGIVAVNGTERVPEPYVLGNVSDVDFDRVFLDSDELWVMGDNRRSSTDSRTFGPVPQDTVIGTVTFRYWPLRRARWFG